VVNTGLLVYVLGGQGERGDFVHPNFGHQLAAKATLISSMIPNEEGCHPLTTTVPLAWCETEEIVAASQEEQYP
jgi:hypothetical protein